MTLPSLHGQHVLVLGLGESGLAMARWCVRHGAQVAVWDSRQSPPQLAALREQIPGVEVRGGTLDAQALQGVQLLLKSPGLAPSDPRVAAALQAARAA
ncbi:MAG TPA: UDP-N-acetylmuramoyl-L-alanine--D-glutamate ligase, partial [Burkholderiaceae bacterium]